MDSIPSLPKELAAAIAAHRFGLSEARLSTVGADPRGWLLAQTGAAAPQRGEGLVSGVEGLKRYAEFVRRRRMAAGNATADTTAAATTADNTTVAATPANSKPEMAAQPGSAEQQFVEHFRQIVQADVRARLSTAALTEQPFNERLAWFWSNHFTVSMAKGSVRGIVGAFEREAIRPQLGGSFEGLLKAVVHHAGMLRYLDNDNSAGPQSQVVQRLAQRRRAGGDTPPRITGLNENLAREVLELHTLGVSNGGAPYGGWGGYTQADVTAFAAVLTGWRVPLRELVMSGSDMPSSRFEPAWHQPGNKTVLGKTYAEGPQALDAVLHDLAVHPSTSRFVAFKLARHFIADDPPPSLVARLEANFRQTGGDLPSLARTLVLAPEAWSAQAVKLKTPEEFVVSSVRLLGLGAQAFVRNADAGVGQLGQRVQAAPSPAGWPDRAEEWLGPDAVWKRVEWSTRVAERLGKQVDARALAAASLGPLLQEATARQIERAADGPQALALLLMAPEFQRR